MCAPAMAIHGPNSWLRTCRSCNLERSAKLMLSSPAASELACTPIVTLSQSNMGWIEAKRIGWSLLWRLYCKRST